jgi:hypothetical protein
MTRLSEADGQQCTIYQYYISVLAAGLGVGNKPPYPKLMRLNAHDGDKYRLID